SPEILPTAHLTAVTISGGSEPVDGILDNLDCAASLQANEHDGTSVLRVPVASMSAELVVAHSSSEPGLASVQSPSEEALVGHADTRLYGALWADRQVSLRDVTVDPGEGTVGSRASFSQHAHVANHPAASQASVRNGLEAAYPQAPSALEHFVATLQLGQVLLYRLDNMNRADSNTLWMRKTRITLPHPAAARGSVTDLTVRLRKN